jgi:hypothetical protein
MIGSFGGLFKKNQVRGDNMGQAAFTADATITVGLAAVLAVET